MKMNMAFNKKLGPVRVAGAGLKATTSATTIRTGGGEKTVHDGPRFRDLEIAEDASQTPAPRRQKPGL